jgi:hypothetical protein
VSQTLCVKRLEWCAIDVTRDRFQAKTLSLAHRTALRDLAAGTFSKLCHTPTRQLGMSLTQRLRFASDVEWHNYGHFLAPKSPWKGLLKQPGMRGIRLQGRREDSAEGHVLVTVEPFKPGHLSVKVPTTSKRQKTRPSTRRRIYIDMIENGFDTSLERAQHSISRSIDGFMNEEDFDGGTD